MADAPAGAGATDAAPNPNWQNVHPKWMFHEPSGMYYHRRRELFFHRESNSWWIWNLPTRTYRRVFLGSAERPDVAPLYALVGLDPSTATNSEGAHWFQTIPAAAPAGQAAPTTNPDERRSFVQEVRGVFEGGMAEVGPRSARLLDDWNTRFSEWFFQTRFGNDLMLIADFQRRCDHSSKYCLAEDYMGDCSICLGLLTDGAPKKVSIQLDCGHFFHYDCVKGWARRGYTVPVSCPSCRNQVSWWRHVQWRPAPSELAASIETVTDRHRAVVKKEAESIVNAALEISKQLPGELGADGRPLPEGAAASGSGKTSAAASSNASPETKNAKGKGDAKGDGKKETIASAAALKKKKEKEAKEAKKAKNDFPLKKSANAKAKPKAAGAFASVDPAEEPFMKPRNFRDFLCGPHTTWQNLQAALEKDDGQPRAVVRVTRRKLPGFVTTVDQWQQVRAKWEVETEAKVKADRMNFVIGE